MHICNAYIIPMNVTYFKLLNEEQPSLGFASKSFITGIPTKARSAPTGAALQEGRALNDGNSEEPAFHTSKKNGNKKRDNNTNISNSDNSKN